MNSQLTPRAVFAAGAIALLAACAEGPTATAPSARVPAVGPDLHIIPVNNPEVEYLVLCKSGPAGTYQFTANASHPVLLDLTNNTYSLTSNTYSVTVAPGAVIPGTTIPGACFTYTTANLHNHNALAGGADDATVTVVETGIPANVMFEKIDIAQKVKVGAAAAVTTNSTTTTNSATVRIGGDGLTPRTLYGASLIFYNVVAPQALTVSKTAVGTYDTQTDWSLTKTVTPTSHSGMAGTVVGSSTWTVTATKTVTNLNYEVTGNITINNPNAYPVSVNVADAMDDATTATVTCPVTGNATGTVPATGSLVCAYVASPTTGSATLNTATVTVTSPSNVSGNTATAAVSFTLDQQLGDQTVDLNDPRFNYTNPISSSTTVNFPEQFSCGPTEEGTRKETNTATLTGPNTSKNASADVTITCARLWSDETATGRGYQWKLTQGAPGNWFMYTPWLTTGSYRGIKDGVDLVAGQHYVAGTITGTRGTTTSITITLNAGFRFASGSDNVKINPMSCTTAQPYVTPGKHTVKKTVSQASNTITVTGLPNTACYGIHVGVQRQN